MPLQNKSTAKHQTSECTRKGWNKIYHAPGLHTTEQIKSICAGGSPQGHGDAVQLLADHHEEHGGQREVDPGVPRHDGQQRLGVGGQPDVVLQQVRLQGRLACGVMIVPRRSEQSEKSLAQVSSPYACISILAERCEN
jgi:hypothetical protein